MAKTVAERMAEYRRRQKERFAAAQAAVASLNAELDLARVKIDRLSDELAAAAAEIEALRERLAAAEASAAADRERLAAIKSHWLVRLLKI